mmetsp:Transcript_121015/g.342413  ORF Transcript_121015/g.342413 Transcript_121015/m.342413 type:complete len:228 (+) Transcript_121015:3-686(+)
MPHSPVQQALRKDFVSDTFEESQVRAKTWPIDRCQVNGPAYVCLSDGFWPSKGSFQGVNDQFGGLPDAEEATPRTRLQPGAFRCFGLGATRDTDNCIPVSFASSDLGKTDDRSKIEAASTCSIAASEDGSSESAPGGGGGDVAGERAKVPRLAATAKAVMAEAARRAGTATLGTPSVSYVVKNTFVESTDQVDLEMKRLRATRFHSVQPAATYDRLDATPQVSDGVI